MRYARLPAHIRVPTILIGSFSVVGRRAHRGFHSRSWSAGRSTAICAYWAKLDFIRREDSSAVEIILVITDCITMPRYYLPYSIAGAPFKVLH